MVDYKKDLKQSAFQKFQQQALGAQKKETEKNKPSLVYGQTQENVAKQKENQAKAADNRIVGLQKDVEQKAGQAIDNSAWQQQKSTNTTQSPIKFSAAQSNQSPGGLEQDYKAKLSEVASKKIEKADSNYQKSSQELAKQQELLNKELEEANKEGITNIANPNELENRAASINSMLMNQQGNAGALGELERYNLNFDPRFAALESMAQQGRINQMRDVSAAAVLRDEQAGRLLDQSTDRFGRGIGEISGNLAEQFSNRQDLMRNEAEQERNRLIAEQQKFLSDNYTDPEINKIREYEKNKAGYVRDSSQIMNSQILPALESLRQKGVNVGDMNDPNFIRNLKNNAGANVENDPGVVRAKSALQNFEKIKNTNPETYKVNIKEMKKQVEDAKKQFEESEDAKIKQVREIEKAYKQMKDLENKSNLGYGEAEARMDALKRLTGGY